MSGDLFEIITVNPYPVDYNAVVDQAKKENKTDFRPQLKENITRDVKPVVENNPVDTSL